MSNSDFLVQSFFLSAGLDTAEALVDHLSVGWQDSAEVVPPVLDPVQKCEGLLEPVLHRLA